jgi:nicotinamide-nucleotide amidase
MRVEFIAIGQELLIGQVVNTNAAWLGAVLRKAGLTLERAWTVPDEADAIRTALAGALAAADVVVLTGGLGPTRDDVTKAVLSDFFGMPLAHDAALEARLRKWFEDRGLPFLPVQTGQAMLPAGCTVLPNLRGTAQGMWFDLDGKVTISLPGDPYEMEGLVRDEVLPRLQTRFAFPATADTTLVYQGIGESLLADRIADLETGWTAQGVSFAYLPNGSVVRLRLSATGHGASAAVMQAEQEVRERTADRLIGARDASPAEFLAEALAARGWRCAVAESCTGGALAAALTAVPGASGWFCGGVVAYMEAMKTAWCGVPTGLLERHGAVSEPVARAMAEGVRERTGAEIGVATTGVAGPTGGTEEVPVGSVWIAVATPEGTQAELFRFGNHRGRTVARAVQAACALAQRAIPAADR